MTLGFPPEREWSDKFWEAACLSDTEISAIIAALGAKYRSRQQRRYSPGTEKESAPVSEEFGQIRADLDENDQLSSTPSAGS